MAPDTLEMARRILQVSAVLLLVGCGTFGRNAPVELRTRRLDMVEQQIRQRGGDRTETVANFSDLRVSKRFERGGSRIEAAFDLYNIFNANPVLAQNVGIGSTLGIPTRVLAPRVIRLGLSARF